MHYQMKLMYLLLVLVTPVYMQHYKQPGMGSAHLCWTLKRLGSVAAVVTADRYQPALRVRTRSYLPNTDVTEPLDYTGKGSIHLIFLSRLLKKKTSTANGAAQAGSLVHIIRLPMMLRGKLYKHSPKKL